MVDVQQEHLTRFQMDFRILSPIVAKKILSLYLPDAKVANWSPFSFKRQVELIHQLHPDLLPFNPLLQEQCFLINMPHAIPQPGNQLPMILRTKYSVLVLQKLAAGEFSHRLTFVHHNMRQLPLRPSAEGRQLYNDLREQWRRLIAWNMSLRADQRYQGPLKVIIAVLPLPANLAAQRSCRWSFERIDGIMMMAFVILTAQGKKFAQSSPDLLQVQRNMILAACYGIPVPIPEPRVVNNARLGVSIADAIVVDKIIGNMNSPIMDATIRDQASSFLIRANNIESDGKYKPMRYQRDQVRVTEPEGLRLWRMEHKPEQLVIKLNAHGAVTDKGFVLLQELTAVPPEDIASQHSTASQRVASLTNAQAIASPCRVPNPVPVDVGTDTDDLQDQHEAEESASQTSQAVSSQICAMIEKDIRQEEVLHLALRARYQDAHQPAAVAAVDFTRTLWAMNTIAGLQPGNEALVAQLKPLADSAIDKLDLQTVNSVLNAPSCYRVDQEWFNKLRRDFEAGVARGIALPDYIRSLARSHTALLDKLTQRNAARVEELRNRN